MSQFSACSTRTGAASIQSSRLERLCLGWPKYLALAALGINLALAATRELGFSRSVTPGLVERFSAKFGRGSSTRLGNWQGFVRAVPAEQRAGNEFALLRSVNAFFNNVPFVSDLAQWGMEDYWASPAEMLAGNGADCEDFSIAKYFTLKELGVPIERLRITYVKAVRLNQAHMVLAYYPAPGTVPLILDNLEDEVRPAAERTDLIPVYSFNDEDVVLLRQGRASASAGSSSQIRLWRALLDKLEKELHY
ncbi:MAG: transglutaminase-like cysteine peptidase [Betaproteobacteria bacterium]|nr:transglutaminase-like cysteine peptidase [Betaproteobacteria bacterium]